MTDTKKVAEIADSLTEAQRRELRFVEGAPYEFFRRNRAWLAARNLCETVPNDGGTLTRLTDLGTRVRSHITGE